ncbi:MAG: hypothetical protein V3U73_14770, partial [bacterium]
AVTSLIGKTTKEQVFAQKDPVKIVRNKLKAEKERLRKLEEEISSEVQIAVAKALTAEETEGA